MSAPWGLFPASWECRSGAACDRHHLLNRISLIIAASRRTCQGRHQEEGHRARPWGPAGSGTGQGVGVSQGHALRCGAPGRRVRDHGQLHRERACGRDADLRGDPATGAGRGLGAPLPTQPQRPQPADPHHQDDRGDHRLRGQRHVRQPDALGGERGGPGPRPRPGDQRDRGRPGGGGPPDRRDGRATGRRPALRHPHHPRARAAREPARRSRRDAELRGSRGVHAVGPARRTRRGPRGGRGAARLGTPRRRLRRRGGPDAPRLGGTAPAVRDRRAAGRVRTRPARHRYGCRRTGSVGRRSHAPRRRTSAIGPVRPR